MPCLLLLQTATELEALGGLVEKIGGMPVVLGSLLLILLFPVLAIAAIGFVLWRVTESARKERENAQAHSERVFQSLNNTIRQVASDSKEGLVALSAELRELRESLEEGRAQRIAKDGEMLSVLQGMQRELAQLAGRVEDVEERLPQRAQAA